MPRTTPPPQISPHQAPSLPNSPLAKRPKTMPAHETSPPAVAPLSASPPLLVKKISPTARTPTRGSAFAAGYDIHASVAITIPARGRALVSTGLQMAIVEGCYGRIAPRSGLAVKNFIDTGAGVIDADYRGEVKILLFNHAETDFEENTDGRYEIVKEGDRIAQLILERIYTPEIQVVEQLEESVRGAGGFGSTG